MKKILYIITGCFILGIGTIQAYDTITAAKLTKVQAALNNAKNAHWDCLEYTVCNECTREYNNVKSAYDNFNKVNR